MATDIGSIRFTIEADSSQLNTAEAAINGLKNGTVQATKATGQFSQSYTQLRAQIDPAFRAQQQYNQSIKVLDAELARGTISLAQYSKNVQQLRANTLGLVGATNGVRGSFRPMGNSIQQVGFQVGDFATQVAGGQSVMLAFGQQASQLAGIFGPGGALLGAVIAIGSAIGGAFVRGMSSGEDGVEGLAEKTRELTEELGRATEQQARFVRGDFTRQILEQQRLIQSRSEEIEELRNRIGRTIQAQLRAGAPLEIAQKATQGLVEALKEAEVESDNADSAIRRLVGELESYNEAISGAGKDSEDAREELAALAESAKVQADTISLTARETALYEINRLAATAADEKAVQAAKDQVNASFDRIEAYKREQEELKNLRELTKITAADDPLLGQVAAQDRGQQIIDQLRSEAEATKRGLDERFAIEEEFKERVMSLRDGLRTGVIENEEELNDLIVRARTERNEQLADVERRSLELLTQSQEQALGALGSAFGNFSEIARQGGEDSFSEYKAFASAEAAIAASLAAIRALAEGGPFLGPILAGSIAALAAVQIANIQSQEYQGARVHGGQVQGGSTYLVGERGPELFTPGATGQISSNKSLQGGGDVTVNVMNAPEGTRTEERTDSEGNRFVDVFIADMARGGPMSRSIQTTFATRRQGR